MTNNYKNILITGGCGFIGSNIVNYFVTKYHNTNFYNIDRLTYCASQNNITVSESTNYKFIFGDICDLNLIKYVLNLYNIDVIMHFAAQSHVDNSFSNSLQYTHDNILGTHTLLEAVRIYKNLKLFIHVSTDEVYGESEIGNNNTLKDETSLLNPTNPYAATKVGAEALANSYYNSYKIPIIITRGNNVYGKNQYPEKLIPKFINLLKNNKKCTIHGKSGNQVRSFIHVDDVCSAFDVILNKGIIGEIYNIGCHDEFSVQEIACILINTIKSDNITNWIEYVTDRDFNDQRYFISNDKLKQLGWEQKVDFTTGLSDVIKWNLETDLDTHWLKK